MIVTALPTSSAAIEREIDDRGRRIVAAKQEQDSLYWRSVIDSLYDEIDDLTAAYVVAWNNEAPS